MTPAQRVTLALLRADINLYKLTIDKKPWKEYQHPRRKNGQFGKGGNTTIPHERQCGTVNGKTKAITGFDESSQPVFLASTTSKSHDKRHKKHADDMGISFRRWVMEAADLLNDSPHDYYLDWEIPDEDSFNRFDTRTSRIVIGDKGKASVNTYFILGKKYYKYYIPDVYIEKPGKKR